MGAKQVIITTKQSDIMKKEFRGREVWKGFDGVLEKGQDVVKMGRIGRFELEC